MALRMKMPIIKEFVDTVKNKYFITELKNAAGVWIHH